MARELRHGDLHAEADAEVGHVVLAGVARGLDLALDPAHSEASGDKDAVAGGELTLDLPGGEPLAVHPDDLDVAAMARARVIERLDHGQVGIRELVVLAYQRDSHRVGGALHPTDEPLPIGQVGWGQLDAEVAQHRLVDALVGELERHLVDRVDVARRDHRADRQVREQRDLLADVLAELLLGAAHHHVRLDADAAQLLDRVLRRLRLQLTRVTQERHEREVYEHAAIAPDLRVELAQRLEERQRLDVAHGAADLGDHDVHVRALGDELDAVLDLVGDVRDHLHGAAEVVAAALTPDHRVVDRAGRGVGGAARVRVREALVVTEVEVRLGAVLRDEHLAVLERAHRAWIDVDVRVELLDGHGQSARDQQPTQRGRRDALPKCGDNTAGDEDEAGFRAVL